MLCATVTDGNGNEKKQLHAALQSGRPFYVIDRGYAEYQLFQDIHDADSHFIGRIRDNAEWPPSWSRNARYPTRQARPAWKV